MAHKLAAVCGDIKYMIVEANRFRAASEAANVRSNALDMVEFSRRESYIKKLEAVQLLLSETLMMVSKAHEDATAIHQSEVDAINKLLNRDDKPQITMNRSWADVAAAPASDEKLDEKKEVEVSKPPSLTRIHITDRITIPAVPIQDFTDVVSSGVLYYIESRDRFAVRLGGVLFSGNIGNIYETKGYKTKECQYGENCKSPRCSFYHPPHPSKVTREYRNFNASDWSYSETVRHSRRKFGSRKNVNTDIARVTQTDARLFMDQVMHDLLCAIIIQENV